MKVRNDGRILATDIVALGLMLFGIGTALVGALFFALTAIEWGRWPLAIAIAVGGALTTAGIAFSRRRRNRT